MAVLALLVAAGLGCGPGTDLGDPRAGAADAAAAASSGGLAAAAAEPDRSPPRFEEVAVDVRADCLRVRLRTDEPVTATVSVLAAGVEERLLLGVSRPAFDLPLRLAASPPGAATAVVEAVDRAGHGSRSPPLALVVPPSATGLVVTEVLPNPVGSDNGGEYVELFNATEAPRALAGLLLEDELGADPLPAVTLPPRGFALVVPSGFVGGAGGVPPPRDGTLVLRVDGRLGKDGLDNAGEAVRLRAADGTVLSTYGGWVDTRAAAWAGKALQRRAPDACDHPTLWSERPQPPTPGW